MADGQLLCVWSQLLYAKRTLSPVRLVLKVTLFLKFFFALVWFKKKKKKTPNSKRWAKKQSGPGDSVDAD